MPTLSKPVLQSITANNSTSIVLHFDQAMDFGDGHISISDGYSQSYLSSGSLLQRLVGVTDARKIGLMEGDNASGDEGQVSVNGNNVTITLSAALKAGVSYSVTMGNGTLYSSAGGDESSFGISSPTQFKFTAPGTIATPSAPTAVAGAAIHFIDNGTSSTDYVTSISAQTVTGTYTGTLGSNDFVQVSLDNGASWHKATASGNNWSYTGGIETANLLAVSGGLGGTLLARVSNTNALSTATASHTYVYNGVAADTAALTGHDVSLASASDTGSLDNDGITKTATSVDVNVQGLHGFHVGDTVRILDTSNSGAIVGHYVIASGDLLYGSGDYIAVNYNNPNFRESLTVSLDAPLSEGTHSLVAVMVDKMGVVSTATSSAGTIVVDNVAPILSGSSPVENGTSVSVNLDKLEITFNENIAIEDGTIVTITDLNSNSYQDVTLYSSDVSGNKLTINLTGTLNSNTEYEVKGAIISDLAGNVGVTGDTALLHFNTGAAAPPQPDAPSFTFSDTAPASDALNSARHSDGVTGDPMIHVGDLTSSEWYYRLSSTGNWIQGSGDSFQLTVAPGSHTGITYAANEVQVKQVVSGVDSEIYSNSAPITVIVPGPTALQDTDQTSGFNAGGKAINGHMHDSSDMPNEIVEVTLDGGVTWLAATTTSTGSGEFTWSLDLNSGSDSLADAVGVRVVDQTGTPGAFPYHGMLPHYYLANDDATYTDTTGSNIVFGGTGADTITVGTSSYVKGGGGNDHIVTGTNSEVHTGAGNDTIVAGAGSFVDAGDGDNTITVTSGAASLVTGSGSDLINLGTYYASVTSVDAGAGTDTLAISSATPVTLESLVNVSGMTGIDVLQLSGGTVINLGVNGTAVTNLSDASHLVIEGGSGNSVQMGANWSLYTVGSTYAEYHAQDGAVVLVAVAMMEVSA
jgi:hypothetical protein